MIPGLSDRTSYTDLLMAFPPRPIKTEAQFWATQAVVDNLIDKNKLTKDEEDYLDLLGTLIYEYEKRSVEIPDIHSVEMIETLAEEYKLDLNDVFKTESATLDILSGRESLTVEHVEKLSQLFKLPPTVFLPSYSHEP